MKKPTGTAPDRAAEEAAEWLLRLQADPSDAEVRESFETWLNLGDGNRAAWEAANRVWKLSALVGPAAESPSAEIHQFKQPTRATGRRRSAMLGWASGMAVAASLFLGFVFYPEIETSLRADYASSIGETRSVELADGTHVLLDSGSAIAVNYSTTDRQISLLSGRAFFDVTKDKARPFRVEADRVDVTVTGTEFDVRLSQEAVSVAVAEGSVRLDREDESGRKSQIGKEDLTPGQMVSIDRSTGEATETSLPVTAVASWRRGRLLIESATIGDLVDELRRYRQGIILVTDSRLASRRVTGVFDLKDPVRALETVVIPHDGHVREITPWLVIVSGS